MDDNIDDEAVYIYVAENNARKEKATLDNAKVSFMLLYQFSNRPIKIIYAFKLRCRHCVEYNTHYAV